LKIFTKDTISGLLFLGIGIAILLVTPAQVPDGTAGLEVGPRYVPRLMAILMIVFSSILILYNLFIEKIKENSEDLKSILPSREALAVLVLIAGWLIGQYFLNYLIVTLIFVFLALLLFRVTKKLDYLIGGSCVFLLFVIFRFFLNVRLP
jgi:Tripartite tricarboxylate transporter TctB family